MRLLLLLVLAFSLAAQTPVPQGDEWGFYVFPDIQDDVTDGTYWTAMVADAVSRVATYKPAFALFVGDLTNFGTAEEYTRVRTGFDALTTAGVPVCFVMGAHDLTAEYITFAGDFLTGKSHFVAQQGDYMRISYELTLPNGRQLLVLAHHTTSTNQIAWLQAQEAAFLADHPGGLVIFLTHEMYLREGTIIPGAQNLIDNWLIADGHVHMWFAGHYNQTSYPPWHYTAQPGLSGNVIHMFDIDYQNLEEPVWRAGTYTLWRVKSNGQVDGCAYKTVAVHPVNPGIGWLGPSDCESFVVEALGRPVSGRTVGMIGFN